MSVEAITIISPGSEILYKATVQVIMLLRHGNGI